MKVWIDPPAGWAHGFPKIYDPDVEGDVGEWLEREGYPDQKLAVYFRSWPVEEQEFTDDS